LGAVEAAVAVLVVISLVAASVHFRQPEALFELGFQPSPEINLGGDPGRTWNLGDVEPQTGGYRIDPSIPLADTQFGPLGYYRLLIDDSLVFAGLDSSGGNLVRYDLEQSEKVWTSSAIVAGQLASEGDHIFAFQSDTLPATDSATLIAIDFETGDVVWEGPELAREPNSWSSLVLSNGAVFATDYLGNVVAVNSDDGSLIWQFPETFAEPPAKEDSTAGELSSSTPEIVANDESVFIGLPAKAVLKLDRETGADLGSIDLLDKYGEDIAYSTVQVRAQRLVVTAVHAERMSDRDDMFGYFPTNVLVFDAESLHLQTRTDLRDYRSNVVLTEDAAFVATAMRPDGIANLYRLDFATGELGEPLPGAHTTRGMFLSVSGDVLMVTGYPTYIGFFDLDSGDPINGFELDSPILETPFEQPAQMWNSNPIVITTLGDIYVIEDEVLPGP
jgi:outer membrane protein assembly factor BamB